MPRKREKQTVRPPDPAAADPRVVHCQVWNGVCEFLSFGDGSVRVYASERPESLDARLLLGMTSEADVRQMMPLLTSADALREAIAESRGDGVNTKEFLVRLWVAKALFPNYTYRGDF